MLGERRENLHLFWVGTIIRILDDRAVAIDENGS